MTGAIPDAFDEPTPLERLSDLTLAARWFVLAVIAAGGVLTFRARRIP